MAVHARGGAGEVRPDARRSTPTSRRCAATRATTCPTSRASGRRPRPSGSSEFGDLDQLVARVDEVKGKAGDALRAHLAQVVQNRQLTELVRDVPIEVMPGDLVRTNWERDEVHQVFDTLEFRVLRDRLYATVEAATPEADEGFEVTFTRARAGRGRAVAGRARAHRRAHRRAHLRVLGRAAPATSPASRSRRPTARAAGSHPTDLDPADEQAVAAWLADESAPKALHDAKGPTLAFAARGWELRGVTSDTALSAYLAMPDQRSYDLADLALRYLRRELRAEEGDGGGQLAFGLDGGDDTAAAESDVLRARAVYELADALDTELARQGGHRAAARPRAAAGRRARRHGAHRHRGRHRAPRRTWSRSSAAR